MLLPVGPAEEELGGGETCVWVWVAGALVVVCTGVPPVAVTLGDADCRLVVVGLADLDAVEVCVPVTRLVPAGPLLAEVPGTEAVAADLS